MAGAVGSGEYQETGIRSERAPAATVFLVLAAGIAADSWLALGPLPAMLAAAASLLLVGLSRRLDVRVVGLLVATFCLGAAAHDRVVRNSSPNSVECFAGSEPRLVRLRGTIVEPPDIEQVEQKFWSRRESPAHRTRCLVKHLALGTESGTWIPAGGCVQVSISGALPAAAVGDEIETIGWLSVPGASRNPGGFDLRSWDQLQGIDARVFTEHAEAVHLVSNHQVSVAGLAASARRMIGKRFETLLSPEGAAVARAMLLGDRTAISDELRDAYRVTGAMHVLAISGMHIIILAALLIFVVRLLRVSPLARSVGVTALIWAYAILTGMDPPVTRAAVFLTVWASAGCLGRPATALNTVAIAGLILLAWNPLVLFDLGAQLSFLAVLGMSWAGRLVPNLASPRVDDGEGNPVSMARRWCGSILRQALLVELMGIGIWLFTGPIIAGEFGLVAPIALPLNLILVPLSTLVLWFGFFLLAVCPISLTAATPFAVLFDGGLWLMNRIVEWAAAVPSGHGMALAPPGWWLAGWYALLLASLIWLRRTPNRARPVVPLLLWGVLALAGPAAARNEPSGLRLTVLDVGHGGAILIETPAGRTLLYDCGSMHDDRRAAEAVWNCLRLRGHRNLDALIISHADLDHCNNVPALLRTGRVEAMFVNRTFLNFKQPAVAEACNAAGDRGVPIRLVVAGDRLWLGPDVEVRVLHPPDRPPGEDDNANSLVLRISYAGRSILLTGDLEGAGQFELFTREAPRRHDILIAPHHGGELANTAEFAWWTRPSFVFVSCGDRVNTRRVAKTYSAARQVLFTSHGGAISARISPQGLLAIETRLGTRPEYQ